jgi:hypothetical protein
MEIATIERCGDGYARYGARLVDEVDSVGGGWLERKQTWIDQNR